MKKVLLIRVLAIIILVTGFLWTAKFWRQGIGTSSSTPKVAATIYPLYDLVQQVAGDRVEVVPIIKPGDSPHTFALTPNQLRELNEVDLVFQIGHGFDDWVGQDLVPAIGVGSTVVDRGVKIKTTAEGEDPHYWLDLVNAQAMVEQIKDELTRLYPDYRLDFASNALIASDNLAKLRQFYRAKFVDQNIKIATFHNAFAYLADSIGFTVVATFEEFPGEEPTPGWLADFIAKVKAEQLTVIYAEPAFSPKSIEAVSQDLGLKIDFLDPEGELATNSTYVRLIQSNLDKILTNAGQ